MSVKIGNISLDRIPLCLAPMAGASFVSFRRICIEQGASFCPTELTSARSIVYNGFERSYRFMEIDPEGEGITCIQLFGTEPEDFVYAINRIAEDPILGRASMIDINMGCPVSKVVKTGAGSALLRDPKRAGRIVSEAAKACGEHGMALTVKTRIGFAPGDGTGEELARVLSGSGAALVTVHGRYAVQMYSGRADMEQVAVMARIVRDNGIPFFANGDIRDGESARDALRTTGADGLMIGRAAVGDPWIFGRIRAFLEGAEEPHEVTVEERCGMLMRELSETASSIGEETAVKEMRSIYPQYIKGLPGSARIKNALMTALTVKEVGEILAEGIEIWT